MKEGQLKNFLHSKSKTFMAFCFCFIIGAALASTLEATTIQATYIFAFIVILIILLILFWSNSLPRFIILASIFFAFGVWRLIITIPNCQNPAELCFFNEQKMIITGQIAEEPDQRMNGTKYVVGVNSVETGHAPSLQTHGRLLLSLPPYPEYNFGDQLKFECNLQSPNNTPSSPCTDGACPVSTFKYDKYLAGQNIWTICGFAKNVTAVGAQNFVPPRDRPIQIILALKSRVSTQINRLWPEPESSFMAGLLYGNKAGLPKELMDDFNKTGLTHIIAVSGFNITIIASVLMSLLIAVGLWRKQAYWVVLSGITFFVIFTGASASAVRAGIMGSLVLTAQYLGQMSRIANALVFTAAVMVLFNPYVVIWDAGFQLSFLATLGLVYLSPILSKKIRISTLSQTLSAIIATLPLILYQFGRLSIVAPLTNILILWIIPYLMLLGFVALILSFVFFPLGQLIAYLAILGLKYVIITVEFFGRQSWSAVEIRVPAWAMIIMYVMLVYFIKRKSKSYDKD